MEGKQPAPDAARFSERYVWDRRGENGETPAIARYAVTNAQESWLATNVWQHSHIDTAGHQQTNHEQAGDE